MWMASTFALTTLAHAVLGWALELAGFRAGVRLVVQLDPVYVVGCPAVVLFFAAVCWRLRFRWLGIALAIIFSYWLVQAEVHGLGTPGSSSFAFVVVIPDGSKAAVCGHNSTATCTVPLRGFFRAGLSGCISRCRAVWEATALGIALGGEPANPFEWVVRGGESLWANSAKFIPTDPSWSGAVIFVAAVNAISDIGLIPMLATYSATAFKTPAIDTVTLTCIAMLRMPSVKDVVSISWDDLTAGLSLQYMGIAIMVSVVLWKLLWDSISDAGIGFNLGYWLSALILRIAGMSGFGLPVSVGLVLFWLCTWRWVSVVAGNNAVDEKLTLRAAPKEKERLGNLLETEVATSYWLLHIVVRALCLYVSRANSLAPQTIVAQVVVFVLSRTKRVQLSCRPSVSESMPRSSGAQQSFVLESDQADDYSQISNGEEITDEEWCRRHNIKLIDEDHDDAISTSPDGFAEWKREKKERARDDLDELDLVTPDSVEEQDFSETCYRAEVERRNYAAACANARRRELDSGRCRNSGKKGFRLEAAESGLTNLQKCERQFASRGLERKLSIIATIFTGMDPKGLVQERLYGDLLRINVIGFPVRYFGHRFEDASSLAVGIVNRLAMMDEQARATKVRLELLKSLAKPRLNVKLFTSTPMGPSDRPAFSHTDYGCTSNPDAAVQKPKPTFAKDITPVVYECTSDSGASDSSSSRPAPTFSGKGKGKAVEPCKVPAHTVEPCKVPVNAPPVATAKPAPEVKSKSAPALTQLEASKVEQQQAPSPAVDENRPARDDASRGRRKRKQPKATKGPGDIGINVPPCLESADAAASASPAPKSGKSAQTEYQSRVCGSFAHPDPTLFRAQLSIVGEPSTSGVWHVHAVTENYVMFAGPLHTDSYGKMGLLATDRYGGFSGVLTPRYEVDPSGQCHVALLVVPVSTILRTEGQGTVTIGLLAKAVTGCRPFSAQNASLHNVVTNLVDDDGRSYTVHPPAQGMIARIDAFQGAPALYHNCSVATVTKNQQLGVGAGSCGSISTTYEGARWCHVAVHGQENVAVLLPPNTPTYSKQVRAALAELAGLSA